MIDNKGFRLHYTVYSIKNGFIFEAHQADFPSIITYFATHKELAEKLLSSSDEFEKRK